MILDGRGSASLSHLGAAAAREVLRSSLRRWEPELASLLDSSGHQLANIGWQGFARLLYHVAASEQTKLANWYDTECEHFEFTLTLAVVGIARIGWLSVGDSPLVVSSHGVTGLTTALDNEGFANQTTFVAASPKGRLGLRGGVIPSTGVTALLAMSDGTATRLLELKQQTPAPAVSELMAAVASGQLQRTGLSEMLKDSSWDRVTRDDRSIAILSRLKSSPTQNP
jgi:hypothetical protein